MRIFSRSLPIANLIKANSCISSEISSYISHSTPHSVLHLERTYQGDCHSYKQGVLHREGTLIDKQGRAEESIGSQNTWFKHRPFNSKTASLNALFSILLGSSAEKLTNQCQGKHLLPSRCKQRDSEPLPGYLFRRAKHVSHKGERVCIPILATDSHPC